MNSYKICDCVTGMKELDDNSIDLIVTDPPYGYSFMGLNWDKALPSLEALQECHRVLKHGAFGFFMCAPRMDVLWRMGQKLELAGFKTDFSFINWAYSSGFPKSAAIDKLIDKRGTENTKYSELSKELCNYLKESREKLGLSQKDIAKHFPSKTGGLTGCVWNWENGANIPTMEQWIILKNILKLDNDNYIKLIERVINKREEAEREIISKKEKLNTFIDGGGYSSGEGNYSKTEINITLPSTEKAKEFEGSFAGFQPKPAFECIITVMKPLSEKSYVNQALKNGKGVTWLGNCRIPFNNNDDIYAKNPHTKRENSRNYTEIYGEYKASEYSVPEGRFPANLLISDNVLDRGIIDKGTKPHPLNSKTDKYEGWGSSLTKKTGVIANYGDSGDFSRYFDLDAWFEKMYSNLPEEQQKTFPHLITPKPSKSEKNESLPDGVINNHPTKRENSRNYTEIYGEYEASEYSVPEGRFPANLLVSDNILDRGIITESKSSGKVDPLRFKKFKEQDGTERKEFCDQEYNPINDSGDFSRYFSLDVWFEKMYSNLPEEQQKTFPYLITPKPSRSEKNENLPEGIVNNHPTVKPVKLFSYLITLGSRIGDTILDPYCGSGTIFPAAEMLNRNAIGFDNDPKNEEIIGYRGRFDNFEIKKVKEIGLDNFF